MTEQNTPAGDGFGNTDWSNVQAAGQQGEGQGFARDQICLHYRRPLYYYIRRKGHSHEDADDLLQGFLLQFILGTDFVSLDPAKGTFRSFVLACLKNYLAKAYRERNAQKRGGGMATISLEAQENEASYMAEPSHNETPEVLFERKWAETVLQRAWAVMEADFARDDRAVLFQELRKVVENTHDDANHAVTAARLGMTPEAFRKALQRFRAQYYKEVRATVASDELAQEETRFIQKALKS